MPTSKCVIGSVIAVVVVVAAGVGVYFAVSSGESQNNDKPNNNTPKDPNDSSTDKLLVKSIDGSIKLFDRHHKSFIDLKIGSADYGIKAFGPHLDQTIYYATTEVGSAIHSSNTKGFPDLPEFTADWIKTAIAVDDVTRNVYVVDRISAQIYVVQGKWQHDLPFESLEEPTDVILVPESGKMLVLDKKKIIMANMDGTDEEVIIGSSNLKAFTADTINGVLYFANDEGISSYDYSKSKKVAVVNGKETAVASLAYKDKVLYFINKKGKSSSSPGTSLDNCRLDESKSEGKCLNVFSVHKSEQLEQLKVYRSDKPQVKNPCGTDNGGCEQLCLLSSNKEKHSCACDKGWVLQPDEKTCSQNDPNDLSTDKLLIKSSDNSIKLFNRKSKSFEDTKVNKGTFRMTSFGPYLDQTIYYATAEPVSVIRSTNAPTYPDLPEFTAPWIKTAIAVDDVTKNIYVVEGASKQIQVIQDKFRHTLGLKLNEPKDLILIPEIGKMFVMENSRIIMANMDGTDEIEVVKVDNLQAMTVDTANGILYFAHEKGISSYDYSKTKKQAFVKKASMKVTSLAYKDKELYFINKQEKSASSPSTSLENCRLDEPKFVGKCHVVFSVHVDEQLDQLKIYQSEKPQTKNPCETTNGGCQQLCLLSSNTERRSCACDEGWVLEADKKSCKKAS